MKVKNINIIAILKELIGAIACAFVISDLVAILFLHFSWTWLGLFTFIAALILTIEFL